MSPKSTFSPPFTQLTAENEKRYKIIYKNIYKKLHQTRKLMEFCIILASQTQFRQLLQLISYSQG